MHMTCEHGPERSHIKMNADVDEGKKLYLNTTSRKPLCGKFHRKQC